MLVFRKHLCEKSQKGGCSKCFCNNPDNDWCNDAEGMVATYSDFHKEYVVGENCYFVERHWLEEVEEEE